MIVQLNMFKNARPFFLNHKQHLNIILSVMLSWLPVEVLAYSVIGEDVEDQANATLAFMAYSVVPDVTTSSLSISQKTTDEPDFFLTQFAGGFNPSTSSPLYLEGDLAYSCYDPEFIFSNGQDEKSVSTKWNSIMASAGIGWDFPLTNELRFRPITNFSLARVQGDASIVSNIILDIKESDFLDGGYINSVGYGGSVMMDYERYRDDYEFDVEWRFTSDKLNGFRSSSDAVEGSAHSLSSNLWACWRAPTQFVFLQRPLRYVVEGAHSRYFGSQKGVLGFDYLSSVGLGVEVDSSAYNAIVTQTRIIARHVFGNNISGFSIGLAVSC